MPAASAVPSRLAALHYSLAYLGAHLAFMPLLVLLVPRRIELLAPGQSAEWLSWVLLADHFPDHTKGRMGGIMTAALPLSSPSVVLVGWLFPHDGAGAFVFAGALAVACFLPLLLDWWLGQACCPATTIRRCPSRRGCRATSPSPGAASWRCNWAPHSHRATSISTSLPCLPRGERRPRC